MLYSYRLLSRIIGTLLAQTLRIPIKKGAVHLFGYFKRNTRRLSNMRDSCQHRSKAGTLAAARASKIGKLTQNIRGKPLTTRPRLTSHRCRTYDDRKSLTGADSCAAASPKTAGATRRLKAAPLKLDQSIFAVEVPACITICRDKRLAHKGMMFRAIRV